MNKAIKNKDQKAFKVINEAFERLIEQMKGESNGIDWSKIKELSNDDCYLMFGFGRFYSLIGPIEKAIKCFQMGLRALI